MQDRTSVAIAQAVLLEGITGYLEEALDRASSAAALSSFEAIGLAARRATILAKAAQILTSTASD
jgi:hypothetical protein